MEPIVMLNHIEKLERALSAMYAGLVVRFGAEADAANFFGLMKADEDAHVNLVGMQKRMVRSNHEMFKDEVDFNMQEIAQIFQEVEHIARGTDKLDEVLRRVYKVESTSAEYYVITAMQKANPEIAKFLVQLGGTFRQHYEMIKDFVGKQGIDLDEVDRERMRQVRVPYTEPVLLNHAMKVRALDISEGGLYLLTGRAFPLKTGVVMEFTLGKRRMNVKGRVQFSQEGIGMGVRFGPMSPEDMDAIKAYIRKTTSETPGGGRSKATAMLFNRGGGGDLRIYINAMMEAGYSVFDMKTFADAVLLLDKKHDFNVILLTVEHEQDESYKLIGFIKRREEFRTIPVVVITTQYSPEVEQRLLDAGATLVLPRMNTSPAKLMESIKQL